MRAFMDRYGVGRGWAAHPRHGGYRRHAGGDDAGNLPHPGDLLCRREAVGEQAAYIRSRAGCARTGTRRLTRWGTEGDGSPTVREGAVSAPSVLPHALTGGPFN